MKGFLYVVMASGQLFFGQSVAITTRQMTTFRDHITTEREYLNILCFKMNANNSEYHRNFAPPKQKGQRYSPTHPSIDMPRHKRCMHDACHIPLPIKRDMAQLIQSRFAKAWNRRKSGTGIFLQMKITHMGCSINQLEAIFCLSYSRFLFFKYAHSGLCKCLKNKKMLCERWKSGQADTL